MLFLILLHTFLCLIDDVRFHTAFPASHPGSVVDVLCPYCLTCARLARNDVHVSDFVCVALRYSPKSAQVQR